MQDLLKKIANHRLYYILKMQEVDVCKFCFSNGEAESQYRSHLLKNSSGLVTCPVLRSFICPICKATGDFAHTQRYCPRNKDGHFNTGASLTELKRRKNAAGNFPSSRKMVWPLPSQSTVRGFYTGNMKTVRSPQLAGAEDEMPMPRSSSYPKTMTDPLPSCYRPPSPPVILASQPPCTQLTMYRHCQYIKYYHELQLKHQKELDELEAKRCQEKVTVPCYTRTFPSTMSVTPPGSPQDRFIFPEVKDKAGNNSSNENKRMKHVVVKKDGYDLGSMLAELRRNTIEVDMK